MFKPIFEGQLNIFLKAPMKDLKAGTLVKLASNGTFDVAESGDIVYGVLAQDVIKREVDNFKLDSVTHVAYQGEKAGIYFNGGLYYTDMTEADVSEGDLLYAGEDGKLSKTVPTDGDKSPVAIAEETAKAGEKVRIRLLK